MKFIIDEDTYIVKEIMLYSKSIHQIEGNNFPLEMHIIGKTADNFL